MLQQIAEMDDVSKRTPTTINGVSATHYSGTLGLAPLTLRMPASMRQQWTAMRNNPGAASADADIWVDPAGHVVRTRTHYSFASISVTATMTLSEVGRPVTVTVPTAVAVAPAMSIKGILPG